MTTAATSAADPAASELFVCSGPQVGARHRLDRDEVVLGRSEECDVPLEDQRASSRHAQVVREGAHHRLVDLASTNGTFVNNQRVHDVLLRPGDLVQIGETLFEYRQQADRVGTPNAQTMALSVPNYGPQGHHYGYGPMPGAIPGQQQQVYGYLPYSPPAQPQVEQAPEPSINIPELLRKAKIIFFALLPYWWLFLLCAVLGGVAGVMRYRLDPPPRKAMFEMTLIPNANDALTEEFSGGKIKFFREAEQNFKSQRLLKQTFSDLGIGEPDRGIVELFQELLTFGRVGGMHSNLYSGSFRHTNPEFATQFLDTHVNNYLDAEMDKALRLVLVNQRFMKKKLSEAEEALQAAERKLLEFKSNNLDALPDQARTVYAQVYELEAQLRQVEKQIEEQSLELRYERQKLKSVSAFTVESQTRTNPYASQVAEIEAKLAAAKAAGKGPMHPDVQRLKSNLQRMRQLYEQNKAGQAESVSSVKNPIYAAAEARVFTLEQSLAVARQQKGRLEKELDSMKSRVARLPERESKYADLVREYKAAKEEHLRLLDRVKQAQQQVELERASAEARYDLITPVQLEYVDESAQEQKKMVMYAAAGFVFGGVLIILDLFRRRKLELGMFMDPRKLGFSR
jgi:pSer/pThr/pTyr-binding forkhead associated (FHA) protein